MAEKEMLHRQKQEERFVEMQAEGMRRQFYEARTGQAFAFLISAMFLLVGAYVAVQGQSWVGGVLGTMGISGIAANFLRKPRESGSAELARESESTRPRRKSRT